MSLNDQTSSYLLKNEMENCCIYECISDEFSIGIWYENKMYGISNQMNHLISSEHHCDCGLENCKLCKPVKKISDPILMIVDRNEIENINLQCALYKVLFFAERCLGLH